MNKERFLYFLHLSNHPKNIIYHTSVGFDPLNVFLGICNLNRGAGDQLFTPASNIVIEVYNAEVIVYGQVIQNSLHGLHCLLEKFGIECILQNGHTVAVFYK